jgi:hypothetical protein
VEHGLDPLPRELGDERRALREIRKEQVVHVRVVQALRRDHRTAEVTRGLNIR